MFQKDFVGDAINTMSLKDRKKLEGKLEKGGLSCFPLHTQTKWNFLMLILNPTSRWVPLNAHVED